jgi:sugar/nucleoside kinase (ribokinase family)
MGKRVLIVGELCVDMIVSGLEGLPKLGQEMVAADLQTVMGSSSAICAAGLARLGAQVDFLGKAGNDYYGDFVASELQRLGVSTSHVIRDPAVRTGVTISLTYPHNRALVTYLGSIAALRLSDIETSILEGYDHMHAGSYFLQKGLQPGLQDLFDTARRAGLTTSLDTGWDPDEEWGGEELLDLLAQVDVFLPNEVEACGITRADNVQQALHQLGQRGNLVVIKLGAEGAMALHDGKIVRSPGFEVHVVDTTGAGDSFDAGFLFANLVQGQQVKDALRFANACGALSTTGYGGTAAQPTLQQVLGLLRA